MGLVNLLLNVFVLLLLARIVLSWIRVGYDSPFRPVADLVFRVTEPVLEPIRRVLPSMGPFDFSPMIAFFAISLLRGALT